jgi:hypothetical protein
MADMVLPCCGSAIEKWCCGCTVQQKCSGTLVENTQDGTGECMVKM